MAQTSAERRLERIGASLGAEGGRLDASALRAALVASGLRPAADARFGALAGRLDAGEPTLALEELAPALELIERAVLDQLAVPEWADFGGELERIFERVARESGGEVASYIPQLARVDPEQFAVAACSVDGQRLELGDADSPFCLQSCCKPVNYCLALEEHGVDGVHALVGREPSGRSFNELSLNEEGLAHNPLINAGAITCCALLQAGRPAAERFDHVATTWSRLMAGRRPGFSNATYLSERRTADRNFALGYMLRESGVLPRETDLVETLELYFQCCSIECDAERLALAAASLAAGGSNPLTGERVFEPETVKSCLSLMSSCGLYDYSGEWAFHVGLPAKSGVAGAIFVVVPNLMGLCAWSPRLDEHGNSVRALAFCEELVRSYSLHAFDELAGARSGRRDPRRSAGELRRGREAALHWAAADGDLEAARRLLAAGVDPNAANPDGRTALHFAARAKQAELVALLLAAGARPEERDREGRRPPLPES